jgi:DNA polymerase III delta prime subunit
MAEPLQKPDDVPQAVDLAEEYKNSGVAEVLDELDRELVGLKPVKQRIREIAALLIVERARKTLGLSHEAPTLHMSFTGNPGTGKTTVALRMASILYRPDNERDYGQEAIEILLQVMENNREDLVVILAGYSDRMDRFFQSNPGFRSRIAHHIDFPDYDDRELLHIAETMLANQNYRLDDEARGLMADYIERRRVQPLFANARSIRNALDRARLRQANRLFSTAKGPVTADALSTICAEDIRASRVFTMGVPDSAKEQAP